MRRGVWAEYDRQCRSEDSEFIVVMIQRSFVYYCHPCVLHVCRIRCWRGILGRQVIDLWITPSVFSIPKYNNDDDGQRVNHHTIIGSITNDGTRAMFSRPRTLFFASTQWVINILYCRSTSRVLLYFNNK